jgi:hypothetical protein
MILSFHILLGIASCSYIYIYIYIWNGYIPSRPTFLVIAFLVHLLTLIICDETYEYISIMSTFMA